MHTSDVSALQVNASFPASLIHHLVHLSPESLEFIQNSQNGYVAEIAEIPVSEALFDTEVAYIVCKAARLVASSNVVEDIANQTEHPGIKAVFLETTRFETGETAIKRALENLDDAFDMKHDVAIVDASITVALIARQYNRNDLSMSTLLNSILFLEDLRLTKPSQIDPPYELLLQAELAKSELTAGHLFDAEEILTSLATKVPDEFEAMKGRTLKLHGTVALYRGHVHEAMGYLAQAHNLLTVGENWLLKAKTAMWLANGHVYLADLDKAKYILLQSARDFARFKDFANMLQANVTVAEHYVVTLEFDRSEKLLNECLIDLQKHNIHDPTVIARLADLAARLGLTREATDLAEHLSQSTKDPNSLAQIRAEYTMSLVAAASLNIGTSVARYKALLKKCSDVALPLKLSIGLDYVGVLLASVMFRPNSKYLTEARHVLSRLVASTRESGSEIMLSQILLFAARMEYMFDNAKKAIQLIDNARRVAHKHSLKNLKSVAGKLHALIENKDPALTTWPADLMTKTSIMVRHTRIFFSTFDPTLRPSNIALLLIRPSGIPIYVRRFTEYSGTEEEIIAGLITTINAIGVEAWKGEPGNIHSIKHEDWAITMERSKGGLLLVLITTEETFETRRRIKMLAEFLDQNREIAASSIRLTPSLHSLVDLMVNSLLEYDGALELSD